MKEYELTPREREVFGEMARLNGTKPEMIYETCHRNDKMYCFHYYAELKKKPPLTDISPLVRLEGLMRVEVYQCDIQDISPLAGIPTLDSIRISGGSKLLPCDLTSLKNLRCLGLRYDYCTIPGVGGLPIKAIYLSRIDSLAGVEGLEKLMHIDISDNRTLSDLSPLSACPNLEYLSAIDTAVDDLMPLKGHSSLKEVHLSNIPVTDVSPLATIPTLEMICLYGSAVENVSCLAALPRLNVLNLRKTRVTDLSAFQGRENILDIERKKLGVQKAGKTADEINAAVEEIREKLDLLGITLRPSLKRSAITAFQEQTGVKLPREYTAFLTWIGDGFEVQFDSFIYRFPPLAELKFDPACVGKRFSHRESWCWEDDDNATDQKIAAASRNGQIELVNCGCGRSFRLIVAGGAKGEVWDMADVGIAPYGNGLDFLDWMKDFLDGKVMG